MPAAPGLRSGGDCIEIGEDLIDGRLGIAVLFRVADGLSGGIDGGDCGSGTVIAPETSTIVSDRTEGIEGEVIRIEGAAVGGKYEIGGDAKPALEDDGETPTGVGVDTDGVIATDEPEVPLADAVLPDTCDAIGDSEDG